MILKYRFINTIENKLLGIVYGMLVYLQSEIHNNNNSDVISLVKINENFFEVDQIIHPYV